MNTLKYFLANNVTQEVKNHLKMYWLALPITVIGLMVIGNAHAQNPDRSHFAPPSVPDNIKVLDGSKVFLVGHATGTQNYVCKPSGSAFKYILFTPEATLSGDNDRQIITHYFSPNPREPNTDSTIVADHLVRATWQHSRDGSTVWAFATPDTTSTDANFVARGAIAWLKLAVVGAQDGPTGGRTLSETTFIQRINTAGGVPPSTGCSSAGDVGNEAFVPYTADYVFYQKEGSQMADPR